MDVKLVVVGGEADSPVIQLRLPAVLGRGRETCVTLPHPLVSRQHCEVFESNGKLYVRDLDSLNGTYVNNERIQGERELPSGDLLTVGTVTFRAVYENGLRTPSRPEAELPRGYQFEQSRVAPPTAATVQPSDTTSDGGDGQRSKLGSTSPDDETDCSAKSIFNRENEIVD